MANYIPILDFGTEDELRVVFDTPPEGDPQNEEIGTEKEQVRSVGGQLFTSDFYDYTNFTLRFILQSNSVALKLKRLFKDYGLKGQSFTYYPHSDDNSIAHTVELSSESVVFNKDHPDGQGGFLWSFEFTLMAVIKTAPRIVVGSVVDTGSSEVPGPVRNLQATNIADTTATLTWTAPTSFGSSTLKHYKITYGSSEFTTTNTSFNLTGLSASTVYNVKVVAVNVEDLESSEATVNFTTAATLPPLSAPTSFVAQETGENSILLAWGAPLNNGGKTITSYQLERIVSGGSNIRYTTQNFNYEDTGLVAGTSYSYRVRAVNADGEGPWSTTQSETTAAAPPAGVPSAPVLKSIVGVDINHPSSQAERLRVTFDKPTDNASDLVRYTFYHWNSENTDIQSIEVPIIRAPGSTNIVVNFFGDGGRTFSQDRPRPVIVFMYMTATNAAGESRRSQIRNTIIGQNFSLTEDGTRINSDGDYNYTNDFGDYDASVSNTINFTRSDLWEGDGSFQNYQNQARVSKIIAMQPSVTEDDEMAVVADVHSGTSNVRRAFLLKLVNKLGNVSEQEWVIKDQISDADKFTDVTAYQTVAGYTRYIFVKDQDNNVRMTRVKFSTLDTFNWLSHGSNRHVGCCYLPIGNEHILLVVDWFSDKIYGYEIIDGQRRSTHDISLPNYLYPRCLWTNQKKVWTLCNADNRLLRTRTDRVGCWELDGTRSPINEFVVDGRSLATRTLEQIDYTGLCVRNNYFLTNLVRASSSSDEGITIIAHKL